MWRFILVSFVFLGWSFYVLSGGSDYEPRVQSIQARAKLDNVRPLARPVAVEVAELETPATTTTDSSSVTHALPLLDDLELTNDDKFEITLASVSAAETSAPALEANIEKAENLTQVPDVTETLVEPVLDQPELTEELATPAADIRKVTGFIVNLRDGPSTYYLAIGSLSKGDEIEVLKDPGEGWLNIRVPGTGQVGWMADWLVTAAAN